MMFKFKVPGKIGGLSRKKMISLVCALALVICFGVSMLMPGGSETGMEAIETSERVQDGENAPDTGIPLHDGDVLVDSLNLQAVPGEGVGDKTAQTAGTVSETALVTSDNLSSPENSDEYFSELRATVDMDRNQIISMLTDVIAETESTSEKENATAQKLKIIDYMEKEKMIESLITSKGMPQCMVLITDNAVNVTVDKQDLQQSDVAKICDIISRETGRSASQVVIQSKY